MILPWGAIVDGAISLSPAGRRGNMLFMASQAIALLGGTGTCIVVAILLGWWVRGVVLWMIRLALVAGALVLAYFAAGHLLADTLAKPTVAAMTKPWKTRSAHIPLCVLDSEELPANGDELNRVLTAGMRRLSVFAPDRNVVALEGAIPQLRSLTIDLTNASAIEDRDALKSAGATPHDRYIAADRFEVKASPLLFRGSKIDLRLSARAVRLGVELDKHRVPLLMLNELQDGRFALDMNQRELESAITAMAREVAAKKEISIDSGELHVVATEPRLLDLDYRVKARRSIVSATVRLKARVRVDLALNATPESLAIEGEGAVGRLVVGLIRPTLDALQGKPIPLKLLPPGEIKLYDLTMTTDDAVHIRAGFGPS